MDNSNLQSYKELYKSKSPRSRVLKDVVCAFAVGGGICALGQLLTNIYLETVGLPKETASLLCSVTLIALSALATGFGVYDKLSKHAGAGSLVPITGFANAVVSPALEFKNEGFILGTGAKMFIIAGPVIVYGVAASALAGLLTMLFGGI